MTIRLEELPNPRLAPFLGRDFTGMTDEMRAALARVPLGYGADWEDLTPDEAKIIRPLNRAHLKAAGLPTDYWSLQMPDRKRARYASYTGWFDPSRPNELVSDVEAYLRAHYCYVEHVRKPCRYLRGLYFMRDALTKYDLIRQVLSPPRIEGEPAKTVISQPRGTTKTVTLIREMCSLMAMIRPYTGIQIMEINEDRTKEEVANIRQDVEESPTIRSEFGGLGELYPKARGTSKKWRDDWLDFISTRTPCFIKGYSAKSAQRGRHPVLFIMDDIEDENTLRQPAHKKEFLHMLFGGLLGMFYSGNHVLLIGTPLLGGVIEQAVRGVGKEQDGFGDEDRYVDHRFDDWNRVRNKIIRVNPDTGERESIMPDHTTVEAYDARIEARGAAAVASEYDCEPIEDGQRVFVRDPYRHGYMHAVRGSAGNREEYYLDLATGEELPWAEFLKTLYVAGGCDPADSLHTSADCGAVVIIGRNHAGAVHILDVCIDRMIVDDWAEKGMWMATEWEASRMGWETVAMQRVVIRMAQRIAKEIEDEGKYPAVNVPIANATTKKAHRVISALRPLYRRNLIRFPRLTPVRLADGTEHVPVEHHNRSHLVELYRQLDLYTDDGLSSGDDGPDALQIAVRAMGHGKGEERQHYDLNDAALAKARSAGLRVDLRSLPSEVLTSRMIAEMAEEFEPRLAGVGVVAEDPWGMGDPYD